MITPHAFTLKQKGGLNRILTECHISSASNPNKVHKAVALWDTGATASVVTKSLASALGLIPQGFTKVIHAGGEDETPIYCVNIVLPSGVQITSVNVTECADQNFGMIIGMDIIGFGDFAITSNNGETWVSFRVPSMSNIDFVKESHFTPQVPLRDSGQTIGRNSSCPCKSGKKYKQCCGKN